MPRLEQPLTILAMKKHFIYMLAASLVLAAPAVTFTSCGDDDPEEIPGGGGVMTQMMFCPTNHRPKTR